MAALLSLTQRVVNLWNFTQRVVNLWNFTQRVVNLWNSLPQRVVELSSGNPLYEAYYRQVDPAHTGKVGPTEAALFLKKSGLSDVILGKIWDVADPEGKGYLDKQGFYVSLRLVACAQNGHDVSLNSLNVTLPPPKFHDSNSPLLIVPSPSSDMHWAVRPEEKAKFDGIFESLSPLNGLLSGDKVKPVLINSNLPLDVLGRVWDLSDVDKDGHLDRDEFAVAMHLVYRALEKEPVPPALPSTLLPPSKRKKQGPSLVGSVPVLPASPPPKDSLRSTPSHGSINSLNSAGSISPKHIKQPINWVVPTNDKVRYDDIFLKIDLDMDGHVSGLEVKDIFMQSALHQNILAHIWALADTKQMGKLNREQFALAMYLIQQKVSKGADPPQVLTPEMIPPSERTTPVSDCASSVGSGDFTGIKELDTISNEISELQREKYVLEQDIREKEEAIRQKTNEVQELQNDLDRENNNLQELESQKQAAQDRLDEMDQQKAKLEDMLNDIRQKCQEENQTISSLKMQIANQESDVQSQEEELSKAKTELNKLQQEESQLEQSIEAGKVQLETIIKSLKSTQDEINQARNKLTQLQDSQQEVSKSIDQYSNALNGSLTSHGGSMTNLADMSDGIAERDSGFTTMDDPFRGKASPFNNNAQELHTDPFQSEDPFKTDPFKGADPFKDSDPFQNDPFAHQQAAASTDPFGADPFKESDPFHNTSSEEFFKKPPKSDPFTSSSTSDPFSREHAVPPKADPFGSSDPFVLATSKGPDPFGTLDPFGTSAFGSGGFADFTQMSKFGNEEEQLEWAKRESERAERERLERLHRQEQEDLELAIALSKAEMSDV
ncbi:epidermal growth factor receptor substrate 15-like 1 isoform X8 [Leucoraja erinacea]|uniref:epidermal growth factor receptor substrate 15-like 1 isoform X8 n=1 Tax=Leucoraja erinaceus TaxID=7782 RepID=UPI0024554F47|nr:epidermal growth factor receptor substrate 15-like 1 isoform X8 [Leucoraja erinacea]